MDDVIDRLRRLGDARNRDVDREPREITLTDDEARELVPLLVRGYNDETPPIEPFVAEVRRTDQYSTFDVIRLTIHHDQDVHVDHPPAGYYHVTLTPLES